MFPPRSCSAANPRKRRGLPIAPLRGWQQLYVDHVLQADREWIWTSSSAPAATP